MSLVEFLRQYWMTNDPRHPQPDAHAPPLDAEEPNNVQNDYAFGEEGEDDVPAAGPVFPPIPAAPVMRPQADIPHPAPQPDIDEEEDDLDAPDIDEGQDVEIRIALHELLGVRGPLMPMLQFLFWLLVFNGCFVFMCVFLPYNVGYKASIVASEIFTGIVVPRIPWVDMSAFVGDFLASIGTLMNQLSDTQRVLRIPDLIHLFNGYSIGIVFVLLFNRICKFGRSFVRVPSVILNFLHDMDWFCDILQITILLLCRIFWLPCIVGVFIIFNINCLTQLPSEILIGYATHYAVGFIAISWGLGIAFMLTSTIALLQLREVLHPDLLAHLIRPQEGHRDLLASLLQDSYFTQCRRLLTSLAVYVSIVIVFVSLPILAYREIFGAEKSHLIIRFCYFVPELQVPLEVLITHSLFLYLLEKYKDNIGIAQHRWLLRVCQKLGLTRFLLPVQFHNVESTDTENLLNCEVFDGRVIVIGEPMVRPPASWDARTRRSTTRWAWQTDEKFELERSVAPRKAPNFWFLRMTLLLLVTWLAVEVVVFSLTVFPIIIGRRIMALFMIPVAYVHDPLCMVIGLYAISCTLVTGYKVVLALWEIPVALVQRVRKNRELMLLIGKFAFHWGVAIPLTIGYLYSLIAISKNDTSVSQWLVKPSYLFSCWRLGTASLNSIYLILIANVQDVVLNRLGLQPAFAEHRNNIVTAYNNIVQSLHENSEDVIQHSTRLYDLITKPFDPIFHYLIVCIACSLVLQVCCILLPDMCIYTFVGESRACGSLRSSFTCDLWTMQRTDCLCLQCVL